MFSIQNPNGVEKAAFTFINLDSKTNKNPPDFYTSISICLDDNFFIKLLS